MNSKVRQGQTGHLLAILANPPLHASTISERRIASAAKILLFDTYEIANMFPVATRSVLEIASLGQDRKTWLDGRESLESAIARAGGILLGYGCQEPTGSARTHHREQTEWVRAMIRARGIPIWMLGDRPHHPSRWQRHTSRFFPGLPFPEALGQALRHSPEHDNH